MSKELVKLPREVAKNLEKCRHGFSDKDVIGITLADHRVFEYEFIQVFANEHFEIFMNALVNGYEIEETPEDIIKAHFDEHWEKQKTSTVNNDISAAICQTIIQVLSALNIKIEGVNA